MSPRQLLRLRETRESSTYDDQKTPAQILQAEAVADDLEEFLDFVISQLRQVLGTADWKDGVPVNLATVLAVLNSLAVERKRQRPLAGVKDNVNLVFTTPELFIAETEKVYRNGVSLERGGDYSISESGGVGTGYDTITLTAGSGLLAWEKLAADYEPDV